MNAIDGMLAREFGSIGAGRVPERAFRRGVDAALYLPFALLPQFGFCVGGLVVLLSALSEMAVRSDRW